MAEETDAATATDTQAAPATPDTAPAEVVGANIEEDVVQAPEVEAGQDAQGEPEAETAKAPPEKPKAPETPAFNPADYGLDDSYRHCKTIAEALRLVETRRSLAEAKITEQGKELGELRKAVKPPEKPAETPRAEEKLVEWTPEQASEWQRLNDEKPWEAEAYRIQQTQAALQPVIDAAVEAATAPLKAELAAIRGEVNAPVMQKAAEEVEAFFAETPEAVPLRPKMVEMYGRLNEGRDASHAFPVYEADLFGLARLEATDAATFGEVFDLVATGRVRFDKALKFVKGGGEVPAAADGLAGRTGARARSASAGKGAGAGPPALITSGDIRDDD